MESCACQQLHHSLYDQESTQFDLVMLVEVVLLLFFDIIIFLAELRHLRPKR